MASRRRLSLFILQVTVFHRESCISMAFSGGSFLERNDALTLSNLLSSPERYAVALNMTVGQVVEAKRIHADASNELFQTMKRSDIPGKSKHIMNCEHRYRHGRHPFVCSRCWCYTPVCICNNMPPKCSLPDNLEVVLWLHHGEWGLTSNTGCILAQTLSPCTMFMKGLPQHDAEFEALLDEKKVLPVVLWPSDSKAGAKTSVPQSISIDELKMRIAEGGARRRVVLIALDGTWRNARRMVSRLPISVCRLDLPDDVVFPQGSSSVSIISPLRSRGPGTSERQVCTAEAVVRALLALGLPADRGERILDATETKVDLVRRYRGKALR